MNPDFYFLVNVLLVSRLAFLLEDGPLKAAGLFFRALVMLAGLCAFRIGGAWAILLALFAAMMVINHVLEKRRKRLEGSRLVLLTVEIILISVFVSPWIGLTLDKDLLASLSGLERYTVLATISMHLCRPNTPVVVLGGLLVLNEANYVLRFLLAGLRVGPIAAVSSVAELTAADRREYNTGRVIGLLERISIYAAVMTGQIGAIGLVLAVKGLARFKEMDHRQFAEYVLVGTLLSAFLAVLVALLVKSLLA